VVYLFLVKRMRSLILLATLTFASLAAASAQEVKSEVQATARSPEDAAKMIGSARYLYHQQVHTMLLAAMAPELARHHDRLKGGTVSYAFQLDSRGHVVSVRTHSTSGSRWGEQTLERIIRTLKFPPVPPQAMKQEQQEGHKFIEVTGEGIGWNPR
jgi:uncharacterized protein (DUF58 family)